MLLKKTKLAGIISLLLCSNASAAVVVDVIAEQTDPSRYGPYVSAMDTSSAAVATTNVATYTSTYGQQFTYDIGAPWTYNEYCKYNSEVCDLFWDGKKGGDGSDGLYAWRRNILNTYNGNYESESTTTIHNASVASIDPVELTQSRKITAMDVDVPVGYGTTNAQFVRRGFYGDDPLTPLFTDNGGFSSAHDATQVIVKSVSFSGVEFNQKLVVGQSSVDWPNSNGSSSRFSACFNAAPDDDRFDYDDLYYCPGFNVQASFWSVSDLSIPKLFSSTWIDNNIGNGSDAIYIANAYAINTSGFAVGFSTKNVFSGDSGGRARATVFMPTVNADSSIKYTMSEIVKPDDDVIRDTVAVDITDTVYDAASKSMVASSGTDASQAFIVVGNRMYKQPQNRSYATEFYTYDVSNGDVRYPFQGNPIKGANSQVSKINNDGLAIGWRDGRGETSPTADGSARHQSAFIYDYKSKKSAYLDDLYCNDIDDSDVRYRFTNAISITDNNSDSYTIVANGYDYVNVENYKNRVGSTPVVLSMTVSKTELDAFDNSSQCPIKAEEDYERSGAGMGWFVLLPTMMLLFRRFKRN
ncbi:DUF3466 family protein [Moritella marina ATCC 15381]|uniref:DUF3466 family protein n=1 Tax=Moritella marina ATCC 15381 TaxID=1202962 RepID=A0A5J6WJ04_MORMI|nr:DUF3466 family protein [Moritella marina]QFI37574.1 DUF3466 family protein [Moritella marina ATCC 15381]